MRAPRQTEGASEVLEPDAKWAACVQLALAPGIGPVFFRQLVHRFGGVQEVFDQPARKLGRFATLVAGARRVKFDRVKRSETICWSDADYPEALKNIYDAPPLLWYRGRRPQVARPRAAIVGTRKATPYGRRVAAEMAGQLSKAGVEVVSGLALGIDGAAHRGALEGDAGTIAVLGSGVDHIFPTLHRELAERIASNGTILSELPPGTPAMAGHFPRRNRIISGLAKATVIVEARERGGALITAQLASSQNRSVYAVPGDLGRRSSAGTNKLIEDAQARLLLDVRSLIKSEWPTLALASENIFVPQDLQREHEALLDCLEIEPKSLDSLCSEMGKNVSDVLVELLALELAGLVRQYAGKQFALTV